MEGVVVIIIIIVGVSFLAKALGAGNRTGNYNRLLTRGRPARGILLQVSSTPSPYSNTPNGQRFEMRAVTLDVEVPGEPPYVVAVQALIPKTMTRDVLPGVTVELRVDPSNRSNVTIVGPGAGFAPTLLATS